MVHVSYIYVFLAHCLCPNSYPMAPTTQDRCAPKCVVEQQICLPLPFLICVVVLLHTVFALCHWQLSTRFVWVSVIPSSTSTCRLEQGTLSRIAASPTHALNASLSRWCSNRRLMHQWRPDTLLPMASSHTAEEPAVPTVPSQLQDFVAELDGWRCLNFPNIGSWKTITSNLLFTNVPTEHQVQSYPDKRGHHRYCDLGLHHRVPDL
jgi:hypothetical protein